MMLTPSQITAILSAPGSYNYWCVASPTGQPFWSHTEVGHVLHAVTAAERLEQTRRALLNL